MPSDDEYRRQIRSLDRDGLLEFWQKIEARDTPGWAAGKAFEFLILRAFELEGAAVRWPYKVRIEGEDLEQIDGAVHSEKLACLCEAKDQDEAVNVEPLAKLRNQLLRRPSAAVGIVFSRSGFTGPARTLARFLFPQTVLLWEGSEIEHALRRSLMMKGLHTKFRYAVEFGLPDFNVELLE